MTTLLTMTQDVLEDISGDEVNSIDDTPEATRVAKIIQGKYMAMMSNRNWHHMRQALKITPRSDSNFPTHMSIEDDLKELIIINYDVAKLTPTSKSYQTMKYKAPDDYKGSDKTLNKLCPILHFDFFKPLLFYCPTLRQPGYQVTVYLPFDNAQPDAQLI